MGFFLKRMVAGEPSATLPKKMADKSMQADATPAVMPAPDASAPVSEMPASAVASPQTGVEAAPAPARKSKPAARKAAPKQAPAKQAPAKKAPAKRAKPIKSEGSDVGKPEALQVPRGGTKDDLKP